MTNKLQPSDIPLTKRESQILEESVTLIQNYLNPSRIILFGSRAKGKARPGSDFDLAVDGCEADNTVQQKLGEAIEEISGLYRVDLIYLKEVDEDFRAVVFKTGKTVYEKRP